MLDELEIKQHDPNYVAQLFHVCYPGVPKKSSCLLDYDLPCVDL